MPALDCRLLADGYCRSQCGALVGVATVVNQAICGQDWSALSLSEVAAAVACECRDVVPEPFGGSGKPRSNISSLVFAAGMQNSKCYRIPTVIHTHKGTLLAFAEQRVNGCGDNGNNNIVVRRSTNGGKSWKPIQVVVNGNGRALSNANPVEVNMGDGRMAVLLHYDTMNNPSRFWTRGGNMQIWSYDDGQTWGDAAEISRYMPLGFRGCMPGPSVGVQAVDGTIYFTCHGFGANAFLYWSTDLGQRWMHSTVIRGLNECSIALLQNQSLLMDCRTGGGDRAQMVWSASGQALTPLTYPEGLEDPNCQGSVIQFQDAIYLSHDDALVTRRHLTVKKSTDNGVLWDAGRVVWTGPSAYSQLVGWQQGSKDMLGVLFEAGETTPYAGIQFVSWVLHTREANTSGSAVDLANAAGDSTVLV